MEKNLWKKGLVFTIIVCFIGAGVIMNNISASPITLVYEPTNPTRIVDEPWESVAAVQASDFHYNDEYISWYRSGLGKVPGEGFIGYETSSDGITWNCTEGNPILGDDYVAPYVVQLNDLFYMFVLNLNDRNLYLYNVTNHTNPIIMNGGNPVYTHSSNPDDWDYRIFNPGVAVVDGVWHMLLGGKSSTSNFKIGYAYSNLSEMDWSAHRTTSYLIDDAGNPWLGYVPDFNSLLTLHGGIFEGKWMVTSHYASLSDDLTQSSSWKSSNNLAIKVPGVHISSPCMMSNFNDTYPIMISYNYACGPTCQAYSSLTLNQFFSHISGQPMYPPVANFTYTPANPTNTDIVQFTNTSTDPDGTIISWWWNFDDGYYSDLQNPIHCYYDSGVYNVTLTVEDDDGGTDNITVSIIVTNPSEDVENLINDIKEMNLNTGLENSLIQKLMNVIQSLDKGLVDNAINQLYTFINQVESQRGKKLTDEQADYLVAEAQMIIDAL